MLDLFGELRDVRRWLEEQALDQDDDCLLRRVIGADGRSRAFINGNAVTMQQLKAIGERLLDIHGQHFHQSLGHKHVQRDLLDYYGKLQGQRDKTGAAFEHWQSLRQKLEDLLAADVDRASRLDLLEFQLHELDALAVTAEELPELQAERQKLLNSGKLAEGVATALGALNQDDAANAGTLLAEASRSVAALCVFDAQLKPVGELLESAGIQVSEAIDELERTRLVTRLFSGTICSGNVTVETKKPISYVLPLMRKTVGMS